MQLFLFYYGFAVLFDVQIDAWPAVAIAFTLYSGAFLGEIWRGSIEAIPRTAVGGVGMPFAQLPPAALIRDPAPGDADLDPADCRISRSSW